MPRDLLASREAVKQEVVKTMPELTRSPESIVGDKASISEPGPASAAGGSFFGEIAKKQGKRDSLHPFTQTLTTADVDTCLRNEHAAFPPHEAAPREKIEYRFRVCGELSLGIFGTPDDTDDKSMDLSNSNRATDQQLDGATSKSPVLLGHVMATKSLNQTVQDSDMAIPSPERTERVGHQEEGRTLCIHSVAISPAYQNRGLGMILLKSYLQRMHDQDVADRVVLLAHDELIPFYSKVGFEDSGESTANFAGGGWHDMVLQLKGENSKFASVFG